MKRCNVITTFAWSMLVCGFTCGSGCSNPSAESRVVIPKERLPAGWKMSSSDVVTGSRTKEFDTEGQPASATKVQIALYEKVHGIDGWDVTIVCLTYPHRNDAMWICNDLRNISDNTDRLVGLHRVLPNTVFYLSMYKDSPDREFFEEYFHATVSAPP